jgi:predicted NUDIX family NTP pyrophosphohydrolase
MPKDTAGILMYRRSGAEPEVLLAHPGGPFWAKKDDGAWTIPKGMPNPGEDLLAAARREFQEETGFIAPGPFLELGKFKQPGGKTVHAWATEGDADPAQLVCNTFVMEWPPRSGKSAEFPEVDRAGWFAPEAAQRKLLKGQAHILVALLRHLTAQR